MTGRGEALGGYPFGFLARMAFLSRASASSLAALVAERLADRAAQGVEPVSLGRAVEGVHGDDHDVGQDADRGEGEADDDRGAAGAGPSALRTSACIRMNISAARTTMAPSASPSIRWWPRPGRAAG